MKRTLSLGLILVLALALTVPVLAQGRGSGWGANLTDDQRSQLETIHKKFHDDTAELRNRIWVKRGELNALLDQANPDPEKAVALQQELSTLQAKMAQARLQLALEERKINPDARFGAFGEEGGQHMRGGGYGMGYGRHMGEGLGPGWCGN